MKPIFTSISPNAEKDDVYRACALLFQPWRWNNGPARVELERTIAEYFGVPFVFACESGRSCLTLLLQSLNLSSSDEVLLQAYTCVAVPNAVLWAGAKPVYVDCDETFTLSLGDLEKKVTPASKVLIVQHTFGSSADMRSLREFANAHNLFLIEDCAHSLSAKKDGRLLGTFGDASFFSFGRDKVISSVFGGAVLTSNPSIAEKMKAMYAHFSYPSRPWVFQQLFHPLLSRSIVNTFNFFSFGKILLWMSKRTGVLSKAVLPAEREGRKPAFALKKMPNALAVLALAQWKKIERFNAHRREIASVYAKGLEGLALTMPNESDVVLRYTIRLNKTCELLAFAKKRGIYLGDWYTTVIAPDHVNYSAIGYVKGACPKAEQYATESANLPTNIHISLEDARKIVACIREFYDRTPN